MPDTFNLSLSRIAACAMQGQALPLKSLNMSSPTPTDQEADRKNPTESAGATPWRVLFVGSDPLWFGQIKRDVGCLHPDWVCLLAPDVGAAAANQEWRTADALVVEAKAGGVREWLEKVKLERPEINCLVRCDLSDKPVVDRWKGLGYSMAASHSDASMLASGLRRNARLLEWMADPAIKRLLPLIRKLPASPRLYTQVTEELRSPYSSLDVIARLIRQDPVMSAKMLQVVNSVFFASHREVTDMLDAAMILGSERIKSLILLAGVFSQYNEADVCPSVEGLLAHSLQVGNHARTIALGETKNAATAEAAFTAGVLHDMGKMVLAGNLPARYREVRVLRASRGLSDHTAELEIFGTTHAQVGACLLASWGLPLPILEAVAWHHEPELSSERGFSLLAAVHAANAFAHEAEGTQAPLHQGFLEGIGLAARCEQWRQMLGLGQVAVEKR
jgi:putative nucleotidyltransferase with HDIG domain